MKSKISEQVYELFACLLKYPDEEVRSIADQIREILQNTIPEACDTFRDFSAFAKDVPINTWEEIYTRTFDVQAISTLDLGYVLFGDDYKRGELLVNLSNEYKKINIDCGSELPDHLPNILRLITRLDDNEIKYDLVYLIIKPALKSIISEFESGSINKKSQVYKKHHNTLINEEIKYGTIYQSVLKTLLLIIESDFNGDKNTLIIPGNLNAEFTKELELPG